MANFCTRCGKPVDECICDPLKFSGLGFIANMRTRMGIGEMDTNDKDVYECGKKIVPECIEKDEGEIPIRQYNLAILRTRWQFKRAEGRLQVTNKRIIFRAKGRSLMGKTLLQQEFAISEIGGLEVRRDWRFGGWDFIWGLFMAVIVNSIFALIISQIYNDNDAVGIVISLLFGLPILLPFFIIKKRFFIKMLLSAAGGGMFIGIAGCSGFGRFFSSSGELEIFFGILAFLALVIELSSLFLFAFKQNLSFLVKGKGVAGIAVMVQADKGSGLLAHILGQGNSSLTSGFSEVLPTEKTESAIREVGAMINDIQALGDFGIEKWKES